MPSRNILKIDVSNEYYHVYARGASRLPVFMNPDDHVAFLNFIGRYLSIKPQQDKSGRKYPHLRGKAELLAYCLMGNHFHLLLYQVDAGAMKTFMQALMTSYTKYFNTTHKRSGPLFESRYKASMIIRQQYLEHISRYIHLNPKNWRSYPYSSIHAYLGAQQPEWLQAGKILELFDSKDDYSDFMNDYEGHKAVLDAVKLESADT